MTIRDCYEACLIELNKVLAPSLLLSDFVYLLNKNIQEYFNRKYISFEKNQQSTDDLRLLIKQTEITNPSDSGNTFFGKGWNCILPSDYVHILGGRAFFKRLKKVDRCGKVGDTFSVGLNKLNTNQAPQVNTNWYMKPSVNRPYYLIIKLTDDTDPSLDPMLPSKDDKQSGTRYGNSVTPIMQIICGDDPAYTLESVLILYLLAPRYINLTQSQLDEIEDHSAVLEFPDYVCNEIVKQLVTLILENSKDPRLQNYAAVNQSIAQ